MTLLAALRRLFCRLGIHVWDHSFYDWGVEPTLPRTCRRCGYSQRNPRVPPKPAPPPTPPGRHR